MGGGWGNAINFSDFKAGEEKQKVYGCKHRFPVEGDVVQVPMQSGKKGYWLFVSIEPCGDPRDMFFATVEALGYEDEGKAPQILKQTVEFDSQVDDVPAYLAMTRDEYYSKKDSNSLHIKGGR